MKRLFKWTFLIFIALIPIILIYVINNPKGVAEIFVDMGGFDKGDKLPYISGEEVEGKEYNTKELRDNRFIIMVSKSDCEVCKSAYPTLKKLKEEKTPFVMVGKGDKKEYEQVKKNHNFNFPIIIADKKIQSDLKMKVFPVFYVVDENGTIIKRLNGFNEEDFNELLKEVEKSA
ncbi:MULTISPECIES: TlpA family protein disulfide reductase [unclassified Oceanobacillus]|uniref:TlpA family protein disulfide reductase n=1 Tax=unclassified Oceanobacillus TaxID=2630292 RepID=UPI00300E6D0D